MVLKIDILIGHKRAYIYKNIALYNLVTEPEVVFKARGRSIISCVDALEILKREILSRYPEWGMEYVIGTSSISMKRQEKDETKGDTINVSEMTIIIKRVSG